ncbi:hypothetical protein F5Y01DRAFT_292978 [Xylaria sp. FL0043]|nr:hypothetical protein F5Y01DRAFT_292978 [Xylaria sp. FL0043]
MRPKLIASALTSGALASTNAARRDTPASNGDSSHQIRHGSSLASGVMTPQSHTWASRSSLVVREDHDECGEKKVYWWPSWSINKKEDCDPWGDDEPYHTSTPKPSCDSKPCESSSDTPSPTSPTSTTSLTTINTLQGTPPPAPSSTITTVPNSAQGSPATTVTVITTPAPAPASASMSPNDPDEVHQNEHSEVSKPVIAAGVVGGLLFLFILLLAYYWLVIRRRRRDRLSEQNPALSKDADLESHVTVDLRNGIQTPPHAPPSSSDGISSFALSAVPGSPRLGHHVIVESAARSLSMPSTPPLPHPGVYPALHRGPMASSPAVNHHPSAAAYAAPRAAYSQAHLPQTYSPTESPQAPVFPPVNHPAPLHIGVMTSRTAPSPSPPMELDSRPPPPRYPGGIETSGLSPTSPLPVSPLSTTSPHEAVAAAGNTPNSSNTISAVSMEESSQHHDIQQQQQQQKYNSAPQPSYEGYEPSALPEVVSPICQLGQTSASLPEYDESAEAIERSGANSDSFTNHHFPYLRHESDEKQALQQSMSRY